RGGFGDESLAEVDNPCGDLRLRQTGVLLDVEHWHDVAAIGSEVGTYYTPEPVGFGGAAVPKVVPGVMVRADQPTRCPGVVDIVHKLRVREANTLSGLGPGPGVARASNTCPGDVAEAGVHINAHRALG